MALVLAFLLLIRAHPCHPWFVGLLGSETVPDLSIEFCGVKAPNPFWLASGPPTNSEYQVRRAFDAGWGGAVWKTLGHEPIVNVSSRYGAIDYDGRKVLGLNNI